MTPYKTMKFTDENGNEFEAMDVDWDKCPPETVLYALKPIKKPKWSVEWHEAGVLVKIPDDSIKVNEKIKAFVEASLEHIYKESVDTDDEQWLINLADDTREAIGDKDE